MNPKEYTVSELIHNPSFRRLVKGMATPEEIEGWNQWMEESDENRARAKTAIAEITEIEFADPKLPDLERQWSRLYTKTVGKQNIRSHRHPGRKSKDALTWMFRLAAVLLLTGMVGLGVYHFSDGDAALTHLEQLTEEKTISTAVGEQKTLRFSNGSRVILNSNSTLTYSMGLLHNQTIKVTLEGEAWFDVESDPSQKEPVFAVATPDGVIRDIGTQFLVTVQPGRSRVVLQEGIVEVEPIRSGGEGQHPGERQGVFSVEKGEMVEFSGPELLRREAVNATFYTAWATGFMQFDQTGIREFAGYVEQRFDVNVQITDPDLADITLDGAVYFRSLGELVRSVSEVTGIPVYRSENRATVYIGNPNE